jgi:hypothetical protein
MEDKELGVEVYQRLNSLGYLNSKGKDRLITLLEVR